MPQPHDPAAAPPRTGQFGAYLTCPRSWTEEGAATLLAGVIRRVQDHQRETLALLRDATPEEAFVIREATLLIKDARDGAAEEAPETPPAETPPADLCAGAPIGPFARLGPLDYTGPRSTVAWKLRLYLKDPDDCRVGERAWVPTARAVALIAERPGAFIMEYGGTVDPLHPAEYVALERIK